MATQTDEQLRLMTQHAQMVGQPLASMIWTVTPQTKLERLDADIGYLERLLKDPSTAGPAPLNPYPCCQFSGVL